MRFAGPLLLLAFSVGVGIGLGEATLRLLRPQVFPVIPPGLFSVRDDGLTVLTPGFTGTISRAEFAAPVTISDFGVRGPGPRPRMDRTFRILAIGDSQTFGFGVLDEETYSRRLEDMLRRRYPETDFQVVNAGAPGYGTVDELAWLRTRADEVEPDLIIAQFLSVNDFRINRTSPLTAPVLAGEATAVPGRTGQADDPPAHATAGPTTISARLMQQIQALKKKSHLATLVSETGSYVGMRLGLLGGMDAMWGEDFTAADSVRTHRLLVLLAAEAQESGVPIVLLYTTGKAQVIAGDGRPLRSAGVMRAAAAEAGVPWIDMTAELRRRPDRQDLYFVRDGHWTAQGHQAVAEVLLERLPDLGLLPDDHDR